MKRLDMIAIWFVSILVIGGCGTAPIEIPESSDADYSTGDAPSHGECMDDRECTGTNPRCDRGTGRCVACLPELDNCAAGSHCVRAESGYRCATACSDSRDCA